MLTEANLELMSNKDGHQKILQTGGAPATDLVGGWAASRATGAGQQNLKRYYVGLL